MSIMDTTNNVAQWTKADIISIIRTCEKFKVKRFRLDGLEIDFTKDEAFSVQESQAVGVATDFGPLTKSGKMSIEKDQTSLIDPGFEAELDQLMVTDPAAYEQAVIDGAMDGKAVKEYGS